MSYEFPAEELLECTRCGAVLPYGMMVFMEDGNILCPDCYDELLNSEEVFEEVVEDNSPTRLSDYEDTMATLNREQQRLNFISYLPEPLKSEFVGAINSGCDPFSDETMMGRVGNLRITDFNAIDFETANSEPSSVCSVGIVFVRGGRIANSFYSLIHPEPDYYTYTCQRVHGIGPSDTDNAPNFKTVWNKVRSKVRQGGVPFIAHNSRFDEGCLKAAFQVYQMDYPDYIFLDTLKIARSYFGKSIPNHQLQTVAAACGYNLQNHHHALADAEACAAIALKIMPLTELL